VVGALPEDVDAVGERVRELDVLLGEQDRQPVALERLAGDRRVK
jgi:hypothetical protein